MKKTSLILAILMFFCTIGTAQPSRLPAAIGRLGKFLKPRPVKPISPGSLGRYTEELYNLRSIPNPGVLHLDPKTWDNTFDKLPYGGSSSKGFPRRIEPSASPFYRTYPTGLSVTSREALSQIRWSTPSIEYIMAQGMEFYKAWFPIKLKKHTIVQQEFLYTVGYYDGKIDGKRDAVLTQAIKEFNQNHGFSLSDHFAPEIDPELSRIKLGKNPLLDEAIAQFKRNPKHPLHKHYESKDSAAFSTLTLQKNLDAYALLFNQLGHSQLTAGAQLAELKGAIAQFQKAQQLPVSGRIDEATATKIEAIFDERARKLKVFGKLSTQEEDADAISAALAAYGKTYQKESVLDAEEVLEKNWKDKTLEFIELGFELTEDVLDLFDLIQTALDYLEEDKNEVQYARIEPYLQQERAFVDYILGAQNLPCELNVITQNDYTFRYLDLGARKLVLRKRAKDWEMLELDVQNNTVRKRVKGEIAVQKFEEVCVLLLAVRSTDSLSYIYISPYPTATQQLRVQLGKETLWFDLKQGKLSSSEMDTLLKAYFLHTSHSVLIQTESETLKDSTVSQLKVDPRVLQQIQQSLNVWAAEASILLLV